MTRPPAGGGRTSGMLGLLFDVHGNLPALEAVLADARDAGVERFALGGDEATFGAWPAETVRRLQELDLAAEVRGNVDRWLVPGQDAEVTGEPALGGVAVARAALGDELVARLGGLPTSATL